MCSRSCSTSVRSIAPPTPRSSSGCTRHAHGAERLVVRRPPRAEQGATRRRQGVRRVSTVPRSPRLHLVGGSSSHGYETALREYISALDLDGAVDMTGPVSDAELSAYYDAVTCSSCAASTRASACRCSRRCSTTSPSLRTSGRPTRPPTSPSVPGARAARPGCRRLRVWRRRRGRSTAAISSWPSRAPSAGSTDRRSISPGPAGGAAAADSPGMPSGVPGVTSAPGRRKSPRTITCVLRIGPIANVCALICRRRLALHEVGQLGVVPPSASDPAAVEFGQFRLLLGSACLRRHSHDLADAVRDVAASSVRSAVLAESRNRPMVWCPPNF